MAYSFSEVLSSNFIQKLRKNKLVEHLYDLSDSEKSGYPAKLCCLLLLLPTTVDLFLKEEYHEFDHLVFKENIQDNKKIDEVSLIESDKSEIIFE